MSRRQGISWSHLKCLIETSLRSCEGFSSNLVVEEKLTRRAPGLSHENYLFSIGSDQYVLRLPRRWQHAGETGAINGLRREAETLRCLGHQAFPYTVPELVCLVEEDGRTIGLIETGVAGTPMDLLAAHGHAEMTLRVIAEVAAATHRLSLTGFTHLAACGTASDHVEAQLASFPLVIWEDFAVARACRTWIKAHLPAHASVLLHGDLLPQNLMHDLGEEFETGVIDWEYARIGDPAYDLAIVTRGGRQPLKVPGGLERLLGWYHEGAGTRLPATAVRVHELLLHLGWLSETAEAELNGTLNGHGPQFYEAQLSSLFRRIRSQSP